ncbi:winged helix-turn-helix transcriptional regulator [Capnocytophaga granulosa]|uniref:winged helix-turn-helix domain-containing protein n=1 Tax=Capnocytophaga granulosa TaxID=45242 RepID=UPI0028D7F932|nr:winged helix-turn-helix transcriptional regulator [Capnocytophaga granulosa]
MKVLGYVNRFSRGVYRVQKELEENGNGKASFDFSLITAFRVVEPISTTYFEEGFGEESDNKSDNKLGESDNKSDNKLGESTNKTLIKSEETPNKSEELPNKLEGLPNKSDNKILSNIEHKIIKAIKENPRITRKELERKIIDERNSVRYYIEKLTKAGVIKREGAKKNGKWVVVEREELEK